MTLTKEGYRPRIVDAELSRKLNVFGAVCVEGPKWCGKTWTSLNHANSAMMIADSSNNFANRALVSSNVDYAFRGDTPHLIDEWQEFPSLWDATKMRVEGGARGLYILTGSSTPVTKGVSHSGAGRIGQVRMRTMSLYESGDSDGSVSLSSLFGRPELSTEISEVTLEDIIDLTLRGGWPSSIGLPADDAMLISEDYIAKTVKEASTLDNKNRDANKILMLVRSLARNESTVVSNTTLCSDIKEYEDEEVSEQTTSSYLNVLSRLFMVENQPSFSTNKRSPVRVGKKPKRHLTDPSLAAAAMGMTTESARRDLRTFGYLFEGLCVRDLSVYSSSFKGSVRHYRDDKGREIDAVVEMPDGRWGAVEIKTGTDGIEDGARSLEKACKVFRDNDWGEPEFMCILCGTAPAAYRRQDGIYVIPPTRLGP